MIKNSKQRTAIKMFLSQRTDHPTASVIYQELQKQYPHISLGTVYRNLSLMSSLGEIRKISTGDDSEHFDGNVAPHYHHICTCCGAVNDIPMDVLSGINELAGNFTEHEINAHQTFFYGICKTCKAEKAMAEISG